MNERISKRLLGPVLASALALLLVLAPSCATKTETRTEYITQTEYVPVYIDITDVVDPVLRFRPDNSTYKIKTKTTTTFDIIDNSIEYQRAWEDWQHYANALEGTLIDIRDLSKSKGAAEDEGHTESV